MKPEQLSPQRYFAWRTAVDLGAKLAELNPEIRKLYENSLTLEEIAEELNVQREYKVTSRVAVTAVGYALDFLLPEYDRQQQRKLHHQAGARKRYRLHGSSFTKEDCKRGADGLYQRLTKKERREKSLAAILSQGKTPWSKSEIKAFKQKYLNRQYQIQRGQNSGLPDMKRIAAELNNQFHMREEVRTNKALSRYAYMHFRY